MTTYQYVVMRKCLYGYKYHAAQFADVVWLSATGLDTDTCIATFTSNTPHMDKHHDNIPYALPEWEYVVMIPEHCLFD